MLFFYSFFHPRVKSVEVAAEVPVVVVPAAVVVGVVVVVVVVVVVADRSFLGLLEHYALC